jgi:N4-gp56 family major capsid protein
VVEYGTQKPVHEREIGAVEQFRFVTSPYFRPWLQAASSATGTTSGTVLSNGAANSGNAPDVYPVLVMAEDAWGQVALKGMGAAKPIYLPAKQINHANPMGRFGYVGATFVKTAVRLNEQWMLRIEVAASALS